MMRIPWLINSFFGYVHSAIHPIYFLKIFQPWYFSLFTLLFLIMAVTAAAVSLDMNCISKDMNYIIFRSFGCIHSFPPFVYL
jgi:hypothetical protein